MTLAEKVGVSEITIGRFTRKLGYRNFKAMKNELKDSSEAGFPWMVGEQLQHFVETPGLPDEADGSMQREIKSLLAVYRSEENTSELQSLMRISYAVFCLKKKNNQHYIEITKQHPPT